MGFKGPKLCLSGFKLTDNVTLLHEKLLAGMESSEKLQVNAMLLVRRDNKVCRPR